LRPRRREALTGSKLSRSRWRSGEAAEDERESRQEPLEVRREPVGAEDDASLRPLARALLALAEQLRREEAP
jgi:hypothetical protein